jgi:hypothetical protein
VTAGPEKTGEQLRARLLKHMQRRRPCRHCGETKLKLRNRGLCWRCYYTPAIRIRYDAQAGRFGSIRPTRENFADRNGGYEPPAKKTRAVAGSIEKLEELAKRAAAKTSLWHEEDGQPDLSPEAEMAARSPDASG